MKKEETNLGRKAAEEKLMQSQELAIDKALNVVGRLQKLNDDVNRSEEPCSTGEAMAEVKIKLLPGGQLPHKAHSTDACYDCYANEDIIVTPRAVAISLGFCMEIPAGYHAEIYPRSSTGLKTYLRMPNSVGIIDSDYRGEVKAIYEAKESKRVPINKGDRICQLQIVRNTPCVLLEVEELSRTGRGDGGFGSTGK